MTIVQLKVLIDGYMEACYGGDWATTLPFPQRKEVTQAFLSGIVQGFAIHREVNVPKTLDNIETILEGLGSL